MRGIVDFQVVRKIIDAPGDQVGFAQTELGKFRRPFFVVEPEWFSVFGTGRRRFRGLHDRAPCADAVFAQPDQQNTDLETLSADLSRAVVMSFSAAAVWRIRRAAPMLPTVLLGETSRYLGGSAATTVGATAVGPSIATLRDHPELVDRAAAQGRALYCWTVDHYEDVRYCRDVGVAWVATNHPGRTKGWLQNGLTGAGRD